MQLSTTLFDVICGALLAFTTLFSILRTRTVRQTIQFSLLWSLLFLAIYHHWTYTLYATLALLTAYISACWATVTSAQIPVHTFNSDEFARVLLTFFHRGCEITWYIEQRSPFHPHVTQSAILDAPLSSTLVQLLLAAHPINTRFSIWMTWAGIVRAINCTVHGAEAPEQLTTANDTIIIRMDEAQRKCILTAHGISSPPLSPQQIALQLKKLWGLSP